jgi:hypothetical protein
MVGREGEKPAQRRRVLLEVNRSRALAALVVSGALAIIVWQVGGGAQANAPVVRVGHVAIEKRSVDHWASMIAGDGFVPDVHDPSLRSPRQQALTLLITYAWLRSEAAREGLRPSHRQIEPLVEERKDASPGGAAGFAAALAESGQTLADVEAEARTGWAAGALARRLRETIDRYAGEQVSNRVVADYYRAHYDRYHLAEQRYYDLYEQIPTRAQALALARRLRGGRPAPNPNKEKPFRPANFRNLPGQAITYRAVFAARRTNVVVGPLPLQGQWCLFILRRILPPRQRPLAEVGKSIERALRAPLERRERARLVAAYRQRWLAQTDCRRGYVVQKCRQFTGPRAPEPQPFSGY